MPFNSQAYRAGFKNGIARLHSFDLLITKQVSGIDARDIAFKCSSAVLPGMQINTGDYMVHGVMRKMPLNVVFATFPITVQVSGDYRERLFFEEWMEKIVDMREGSSNRYAVRYFDDITSDVKMNIYDVRGNLAKCYILQDAYPTSMSDIQYSWDSVDSIAEFNVELSYLRWKPDL